MKKEQRPRVAIRHFAVIDNCSQCTFARVDRFAGFVGFQYVCTRIEPHKVIVAHAVVDDDLEPVPDWCPIRIDKQQTEAQSVDRFSAIVEEL